MFDVLKGEGSLCFLEGSLGFESLTAPIKGGNAVSCEKCPAQVVKPGSVGKCIFALACLMLLELGQIR